MAELQYRYATMNSGKTLDLIHNAYNYEENGFQVLVLKPQIDTKAGNMIISRVGMTRKVDFLIQKNDNIFKDISKNRLKFRISGGKAALVCQGSRLLFLQAQRS